MNKEKIKKIQRERLVSIDNVIFEPSPRDKYINEYTNGQFEKDYIHLDKIIRRSCLACIFTSVASMIYVFFFLQ